LAKIALYSEVISRLTTGANITAANVESPSANNIHINLLRSFISIGFNNQKHRTIEKAATDGRIKEGCGFF